MEIHGRVGLQQSDFKERTFLLDNKNLKSRHIAFLLITPLIFYCLI